MVTDMGSEDKVCEDAGLEGMCIPRCWILKVGEDREKKSQNSPSSGRTKLSTPAC